MKVCIIGNGLVSLILTKVLSKKAISVDIFSNSTFKKYSPTRTVGITKSNLDYLSQNVLNIEKISWKINQIKIFTENFKKGEILNFTNPDKQSFFIIKNQDFFEVLKKNLTKNKLVKFKYDKDYQKIFKDNYDLIINCDPNHQITKKFFSKKFVKKYNSSAFTTIVSHEKLKKNDVAFQIFTRNGPIAFLPVSETKTSIVYSFKTKLNNISDISKLIYKFNPVYKIKKINDISKFELKSLNLRNYYKDNILAFGDLLHQVHPLAGQGFNMTLRDISYLSTLIDERINLGLTIDSTICRDFEKNLKDKNFIFSTGIDLIYEFFNFESRTNNELISKSLNILGKNKLFNSFFKKFADKGIRP